MLKSVYFFFIGFYKTIVVMFILMDNFDSKKFEQMEEAIYDKYVPKMDEHFKFLFRIFLVVILVGVIVLSWDFFFIKLYKYMYLFYGDSLIEWRRFFFNKRKLIHNIKAITIQVWLGFSFFFQLYATFHIFIVLHRANISRIQSKDIEEKFHLILIILENLVLVFGGIIFAYLFIVASYHLCGETPLFYFKYSSK